MKPVIAILGGTGDLPDRLGRHIGPLLAISLVMETASAATPSPSLVARFAGQVQTA